MGASVSAGVWLAARRGRRSPRALLVLDAVGTVTAIVPYTLMSVLGQTGFAGVLMTALTVMLVLQTRALLVPSDARRTFAISLSASLLSFGLALGAHLGGYAPDSDYDLVQVALNLGMWLAVIIAVSTIASAVLFGLRQQVREARRLGQYTLLDKLGEGGMGQVYRARHALLRRPTAIKLLPASEAASTSVRRFEKEVQLTASLVHPNTITVFDYGRTPDGVFYYAMEYLEGGDLEHVVAVGGPMPEARVVHVLAQIAAGLAEAHGIGLIHRDIKPANVLLVGQRHVADLAKLLDFGLVRELSTDDASELTQTDTVLGTPLYLAPEGITTPGDVDPRADLYALGAVGYYLLTGEHVFSGRTVVEICSHHLHTAPVPPSQRLGAPVSEVLEEILMTCLEKDRELRPASADALRAMLLSCEDIGLWTDTDARQWWDAHGDAVALERGGGSVVSATAQTLEVDPLGRG